MRIKIGALELSNPLMVASGTFGYGLEYSDLVDVDQLGAITTKTITRDPRAGNPPPRIWETPSGMLNSIGLENVGLENFISSKLPALGGIHSKVVVSIMAESPEGFAELAQALNSYDRVDAFELNLSCPNVKHNVKKFNLMAQDADTVSEVVKAVRGVSTKPVIAKLAPGVADIAEIASAAHSAGADAIVVMNTLRGMAIDIETRRPRLANMIGGLSGPAIKPVAVRIVWEVFNAVGKGDNAIPVIGMGGVRNAEDVIEFMIAGASAVALGTYIFTDPASVGNIPAGIEEYLKRHGKKDINEIIGKVESANGGSNNCRT